MAGSSSGGGGNSNSGSNVNSSISNANVSTRRRQILPARYSLIQEDDEGSEKDVGGATAALAAATAESMNEEKERKTSTDNLLGQPQNVKLNGMIKGAASAAADAAAAAAEKDVGAKNTNQEEEEKVPWDDLVTISPASLASTASTTTTAGLTEKETVENTNSKNNENTFLSPSLHQQQHHDQQQQHEEKIFPHSKTAEHHLNFTASTKTTSSDDLISTQRQQQQQHHRPPPPSPADFTAAAASTATTTPLPPPFSSASLHTFSNTYTGHVLSFISNRFIRKSNIQTHSGSALAGFLALLLVTCANYMLGPMRDAAALAVGVSHIPSLTLASTVLALASSVPVGWLFEAPDPRRRRLWKKMGLTRGETQGTSLALFYRCFGIMLVGYAAGFKIVEVFSTDNEETAEILINSVSSTEQVDDDAGGGLVQSFIVCYRTLRSVLTSIARSKFGKLFYVAFFLVVHLMKLHSLSLIWGVTTEAMEYEEQAEAREKRRLQIMKMNLEWGFDAHGCKNNTGVVSVGPNSDDVNNNMSSSNDEGLRHRRTDSWRHHKPKLMTIQSGERLGSEDLAAQTTTAATTTTAGGASSSSSDSKGDNSGNTGSGGSGGKRSRARLKRLAFVGFGGTLGGITGSIITSYTAHILHLSGLLLLAAFFLELSANLSIELGRIMKRHWEEEQRQLLKSNDNLAALGSGGDGQSSSTGGGMGSVQSTNEEQQQHEIDPSMKRVSSLGTMKRVSSGNSLSGIRRARSASSINTLKDPTNPNKVAASKENSTVAEEEQVDDNSFSQRLLRGVTTILRSRLLMAIFIYNALYASTSVLLSFQRAELVANRNVEETSSSAESDTAFLAKINIASSVAVFVLQASGMGAFIANSCGQRGTLSLIPIVRLCGVLLLAWWHIKGDGKPPNLILFLLLDEFTKVVNFAVAKPVRESLWRGLSNEARYEAKPIVDTLANRWGGGSAAFCVSAVDKIIDFTNFGQKADDGTKSLFGFPPILVLCMIVAVWWTVVSADLGHIRHRIDIELKKHQ